MDTFRIEDAAGLAQVVHGTVDPAARSMFAIVKDEMALLPAFVAHYRALGIEQFVVFDDASTDDTRAFLAQQPDCVVLAGPRGFGEQIRYVDPEGAARVERVGTYLKIAVPHLWFDGAYVAYFDADEFLILPDGMTLADVWARLEAEGAAAAVASVVEFFPETVAGLKAPMPHDFAGLIAAYPWFQPERLVETVAGAQPTLVGESKTARLFRAFDIRPEVRRTGWQRLWMPRKAREAQSFMRSPRHKTPIVRRDAHTRLTGSHAANLPPSSDILLTIAHFVFTAQFADKIARAQAWGAHANGASKYRYYARLLERMEAEGGSFLDAASVRYEGPDQLIDAGLMRW
ncbi:glycosyltransferase family 2 protein [Pseudaestuariivita atlantica]|uniref:Glycosyl transferase family 2 n=1 Tax=Pseudaestuariivita atlantica TaxID=1317121 RepID=A0A0L1JUV1_9RHOB|nr:glycosyltransferase family 2 protein [Pseudaestuariivita atlantica]KNG95546.1 hypothetical protein ATO11_02845 [Pseudaestuariivita atlantica]